MRDGYVVDMTDNAANADNSVAPDPIDAEAATIDARSEDAPEQIEELIEDAQALGRDAQQPGEEPLPPPTPGS
jgi:hypothetical protein